MQNQYGWNLLQTPLFFEITQNVTQLSLADLPPEARKVKLHIWMQSGGCESSGHVTWSLFTKVDIIKVHAYAYDQNAWSFYSDNCAIRLDERKIIEVSRSGNFPQYHFGIYVEVLGYK